MCVFCTGAFARFAARFHPASAPPPTAGEASQNRARTEAASASSHTDGTERRTTDDSSAQARDLNR
jgi:hypothetical protein